MSDSAVASRRNALIAAITTDVNLGLLLQGEQVYIRRAPQAAPLPYILLTQTIETDRGYVMQPGQEGIEDMSCWHIDIHGAQEVYEALYKCLNKRKIPLVGNLQVTGSLIYLSDLEDPTREAWGVVARWRARTINAA